MIPHKVDFNLSSPLELEQQQSQILSHGPRVEPGQKMGSPALRPEVLKFTSEKVRKSKVNKLSPAEYESKIFSDILKDISS